MKKYRYKLKVVLTICLLALLVNLSAPVSAHAVSLFGYDIPKDFKGIVTRTFNKYFSKDKNDQDSKDVLPVVVEEKEKEEVKDNTKEEEKEKVKELDSIKAVVSDENLKKVADLKDTKDLKVEKGEGGLTKVVADESTVNRLISEYANDVEFAGYKIKSITVNFEENTIYVSTIINEKTILDLTIEVGNDGKSFIIKDISNPSKDISFIKMFVLKNTLKTIDLDKLQPYINGENGQLEKIVIAKDKAEVYIKY